MSNDEPRTTLDIIRGLLEFAQEREWVGEYMSCARGCCRYWKVHCLECGADQGEPGSDAYQKHEPGCRLAASIREAEAFLAVEDEIDHGRGYDEALPDHPA